jgi:hypothetical protein
VSRAQPRARFRFLASETGRRARIHKLAALFDDALHVSQRGNRSVI